MNSKITWFWPCAHCLPRDGCHSFDECCEDSTIPLKATGASVWLNAIKRNLECSKSMKAGKSQTHTSVAGGHHSGCYIVNVNLLLAFLTCEVSHYNITKKKSPPLSMMHLLVTKGCCLVQVMPTAKLTSSPLFNPLQPTPMQLSSSQQSQVSVGDLVLWPQAIAQCWEKEGGKEGLTHLFLCWQSSPQSNKCHRQQV